MSQKEKPRGESRGAARGAAKSEVWSIKFTPGDAKNQLSPASERRIIELTGQLEDLNEALKHDHGSDAWLDAYARFLEISAELIRLKIGGGGGGGR